MAREDFVKFYEQHGSKLEKIDNPHDFVKSAIAEGSKAGFSFGEQDVIDVMEASAKKANPQLSDNQLEGVVGGAGTLEGTTAVPTVKMTTLGKVGAVGLKPGSQLPNPGSLVGSTAMCCW
jgi:hypothetical protein